MHGSRTSGNRLGGLPLANIDAVLKQRGASLGAHATADFARRIDAWDASAIHDRVGWWATELRDRWPDLLRGETAAIEAIPC